MEYPTASEQPLFTVNYGYSLPVGLVEGTVYSFKNAGSALYLDVCGGTDADNNNVAQYKGNSTVSQDFKLEKSSTGNGYILRSQVGGKTRVLDIYKSNGRVENGNNVQIYRNVDPIAQEWLIIPVNSANYKIVPRSNPALALTSYGSSNGSASGKSTTSAGNVFVSTYTGNNTNQWWSIERENGVFIQPSTTLLEDGEYYLNSRSTSKYLRNVSGSVQGANGTTAALGTSIKWKFTNMGGKYLIQPANNTSLYLSGGSTTDNSVRLVTLASSIPSECLWTVTKSNLYSNQITIKSNIGRTLCSIGSTINAEIYPPMNDEWRAVTSVVDPPNNFPVTCADLYITQYKAPSVSNTGATFVLSRDFQYNIASASPSGCVTIDVISGTTRITGSKAGTAQIKATHKPSQKTSYFNVTVRKDTIIILPGIMGSRIFAKETISIGDDIFPIGSQLWEPNYYGTIDVPARIRALACNINGSPIYASGTYDPIENLNIPYSVNNVVYGTQNLYANLYLGLLNTFEHEYDVVLYEYDWRKDPYDIANELNAYINDNCGRVIFVSHSMGGLVSSYYLAKGSAQRDRVIKHISLGTPYLGSEQIPYMMITGSILGFPEDVVVADPVKEIINNLRSIYALLPPEKYFRPYVNYNTPDQTNLTYNTYSDTIEGLAEKYSKWNYTLANQSFAHHSLLFDANGQHITRSVDSYYIIGDGEDTAQRSLVVTSSVADMMTVILTDITDDGDQTVTIHSATINGKTDPNKTFYTYGIEHQSLGGGADSSSLNRNKVVNFVKAIINDQVQSMSASTLANTYNMYRTRQ